MLVDLHAHYPMHVLPDGKGRTQIALRRWEAERWRARLVDLISRLFNYEGPGDTPSVTIDLMRAGEVGIGLSVLYSPFDEIDLRLEYASPPRPEYIGHLLDQLKDVEKDVARHHGAMVVKNGIDLEHAIDENKIGLVHCVEGGFALGATEDDVCQNVGKLAMAGVAYVTLAHLFWRQVATNAPALPFLPDWLYRLLFRQPDDEGLGPLGRAAVEAMLDEGIIVDVTHMSQKSLSETFALVKNRDHGDRVPVIASHGACSFDGFAYNMSPETIRSIAQHGGVIGIILCRHYISRKLRPRHPKTLDDSVALLCAHVDRICEITDSFDFVAIGSDLDGYIKPALPGLQDMGRMKELQKRLYEHYGSAKAEKLCQGNALRVLRSRFA